MKTKKKPKSSGLSDKEIRIIFQGVIEATKVIDQVSGGCNLVSLNKAADILSKLILEKSKK